jgi:hypothetical protein
MKRWIGRSALVAMSIIAIVAAGAASAQASCPPLDPVCVVDEVEDDAPGLVDDTVDAIETPVDDVIDPVVDPVVDTLVGTVDDLLGDGKTEPPDPGGSDNGNGSHPSQGHRGGAGSSGSRDRGSVDVGPRVHERPVLVPFVEPIVLERAASDATEAPTAGSGRVGAAIGAVARSLAIVLTLFGLVVAFATFQDRLDRSDPRLALAPIRSDEVSFA